MADPSAAEERLLAEMAEQPFVLSRAATAQAAAAGRVAAMVRAARAVVFVARGSSDHAAIYGRYLFETRNRLLTALAAPSAVTLYRAGPRLEGCVVIGVSQSGRGADVVAYLEHARAQGAHTVAIVNDVASPLALAAEHVLDCMAGPEVSVPATKTVTAQMALLALVSFTLDGTDAAAAFSTLPAAIDEALSLRPDAARLAAHLARTEGLSVVGRGLAFPVALELGLKLKEMADTRAEPFSAADFLHGPVTLVDADHPVIALDVGGPTTGAALDTVVQVRRRGGTALLLRAGHSPGSSAPGAIELALRHPVPEALAPIAALVLAQQLALETARARGLDPATPRGLTKVTSTR